MKKHWSRNLLFIILALGPLHFSVQAQSEWHPNCFYISSTGALTWWREMDLKSQDKTNGDFTSLITDYRPGYGVGAAVGTVFCQNCRLEVEGYFRNNNGKRLVRNSSLSSQCVQGQCDSSTCGESCSCTDTCLSSCCPGATPTTINVTQSFNPCCYYRSFSLMANVFYDFCLCNRVTWYVGGGVGPAWVEFRLKTSDPNNTEVKLDSIRFAYQVMTGIGYQFTDNLWLTAGYRLWGTLEEKHGHANGLKLSEERIPLALSVVELSLRVMF